MSDARTITKDLRQWLGWHGKRAVAANVFLLGSPFECDLVSISKSLHFIEFEIKLSVADYRRDFHKRGLGPTKHDMYRGVADPRSTNRKRQFPIPKQFYFVTPFGMLESVPEHCGLIEYLTPEQRAKEQLRRHPIRVVKEAPLNKRATKLDTDVIINVLEKTSAKVAY